MGEKRNKNSQKKRKKKSHKYKDQLDSLTRRKKEKCDKDKSGTIEKRTKYVERLQYKQLQVSLA